MWFPLLLVGAAAAAVVYYYRLQSRPSKCPPGPRRLPMLGNLLDYGTTPQYSLLSLSRRWGPIMQLQMGVQSMIFINDYELYHQLMKGSKLLHRLPPGRMEFLDYCTGYGRTMFVSSGEKWNSMRKIFHSQLFSKHGMTATNIENKIKKEITVLCDTFQSNCDRPYNPFLALKLLAWNVVGQMLYSDRFADINDPAFKTMVPVYDELFDLCATGNPRDFFPWMKVFKSDKMDLVKSHVKRRDSTLGEMVKRHEDWIEEQKKTLGDVNIIQPRDFLDLLILLRERNPGQYDNLTPEQLRYHVVEITAAGTDSTTNTLYWFLLCLANNPRVQQKLHEEMDRVIGDREIQPADRVSLPYLEAVFHEVMRYRTVLPLALPHYTPTPLPFTLNGQEFEIPADSTVFPNILAMHNDPQIWGEDVLEFRPERILNLSSEQRTKYLVAFGRGGRACIGENLAQLNLFLTEANLVQRFFFQRLDENKKIDDSSVMGVTLHSNQYEIIVKNRK